MTVGRSSEPCQGRETGGEMSSAPARLRDREARRSGPRKSARAKPRGRSAPARALDAAIEAERRHVMSAMHPVVQMLGTIVGHHVEVVLHDLTHPESSIVAIANGHVSNRRVGHSILSGPKHDRGFAAARGSLTESGNAVHSVVDGYPTLTRAGTRLKSSTVVFRDAAGEPFAALCLNADHTIVEA